MRLGSYDPGCRGQTCQKVWLIFGLRECSAVARKKLVIIFKVSQRLPKLVRPRRVCMLVQCQTSQLMGWIYEKKVLSNLFLDFLSMKLNRLMTGLFALGLVALLACGAQAQGRPGQGGPGGGFRGGSGGPGGPGGGFRGGFGGGPGGGNSMFLLRIEEVQTELEISPAQKEALEKLAEQGRGERPDFGNFREMSEEERQQAFEKMRKQAEERAEEMKAQLEEVLLPQQLERLEQISLQLRGVQALDDPEVAAKLGLSEEQKTKLAEARQSQGEKMRERMREMFQGGGGGPQGDIREAMGKMREEMEKEILAVLTSSQQAKFEELKGEKFEMPENMGRGGFGGRGGQGGPGGAPGGRRGGNRPQAE